MEPQNSAGKMVTFCFTELVAYFEGELQNNSFYCPVAIVFEKQVLQMMQAHVEFEIHLWKQKIDRCSCDCLIFAE
jgi:hypothetical protein